MTVTPDVILIDTVPQQRREGERERERGIEVKKKEGEGREGRAALLLPRGVDLIGKVRNISYEI